MDLESGGELRHERMIAVRQWAEFLLNVIFNHYKISLQIIKFDTSVICKNNQKIINFIKEKYRMENW
jgi:hypothetical protein